MPTDCVFTYRQLNEMQIYNANDNEKEWDLTRIDFKLGQRIDSKGEKEFFETSAWSKISEGSRTQERDTQSAEMKLFGVYS